MSLFDHLTARGFFQTTTDRAALRAALDGPPLTFYCGFDPTGTSLHVGHLLPVMLMRWLQQAGHRAIVVLGGGTAMVGDPSGKDRTREILTPEKIASNLASMRPQMERFLVLDGQRGFVVDNASWLMGLGYIAFLRDVGQHFSVNRMLSAESAKQRLERNQGLSFIEFNYHLLQSYDYLVLHRQHGCSLQIGGDDQWFNILGGADLIRREHGAEVHAATVPLMMTADGKKMGKTESGSVWLEPALVSPFQYYQYWVNVQDADVERFLKLYTALPLDEVARLAALQGADIRTAKQALAHAATALAHGDAAADAAREAAAALFSGGGEAAGAPTVALSLPAPLLDALVVGGLAKSKSEARRLVEQGGVRLDDTRLTDPFASVEAPGVLWAGKKKAVRIQAAG